jgi:hypothetical protein
MGVTLMSELIFDPSSRFDIAIGISRSSAAYFRFGPELEKRSDSSWERPAPESSSAGHATH